MAFQMAGGTLVATVMGMIVVFGVYPHIDGFLLLWAALMPFLLLGVFMTHAARRWPATASAIASSSAFSPVPTT